MNQAEARENAERILEDNGHAPMFYQFIKTIVAVHDMNLKFREELAMTPRETASCVAAAGATYVKMLAEGEVDTQIPINRELIKLYEERAAKQAAAAVKAATNG